MCLIAISNATVIAFSHSQAGYTLEVTEVISGRGVSVEDQPICWVQFKQVSRTDNSIFLFLYPELTEFHTGSSASTCYGFTHGKHGA